MRAQRMLLVIALAGCPGGSGALGDRCGDTGDCSSELQCLASSCVPRCQRGPDCGDGYTCDGDGMCRVSTGQAGAACASETACAPGLSCQLDDPSTPGTGALSAACTSPNAGAPPSAACDVDADCRNGTCALQHCVDLCADTRDCPLDMSCQTIPRLRDISTVSGRFTGCLPTSGTLQWQIPLSAPAALVALPVPSGATSVSVVFSNGDQTQLVGATSVVAPDTTTQQSCPGASCAPLDALPTDLFYANPIRHAPQLGESVLAIPSSPDAPIQSGVYMLGVSSLHANGSAGSAIPTLTVVAKMDASSTLDLHFHILDLSDHPCAAELGTTTLTAATAPELTSFKSDYLGEIKSIISHGGIALGDVTYDDISNHPDLDGLDVKDAGSLLRLGSYRSGINVFLVRTLSPVGLEAFGPNPGPAGLANTSESGIVIGMDTLCYRSWTQLARLTAHELARYMGLYNNVEADFDEMSNPSPRDPINDSDTTNANLMFYSEFGGVELSEGQREILAKSAVLR